VEPVPRRLGLGRGELEVEPARPFDDINNKAVDIDGCRVDDGPDRRRIEARGHRYQPPQLRRRRAARIRAARRLAVAFPFQRADQPRRLEDVEQCLVEPVPRRLGLGRGELEVEPARPFDDINNKAVDIDGCRVDDGPDRRRIEARGHRYQPPQLGCRRAARRLAARQPVAFAFQRADQP